MGQVVTTSQTYMTNRYGKRLVDAIQLQFFRNSCIRYWPDIRFAGCYTHKILH